MIVVRETSRPGCVSSEKARWESGLDIRLGIYERDGLLILIFEECITEGSRAVRRPLESHEVALDDFCAAITKQFCFQDWAVCAATVVI